jgi:hypothetical protein
MVRNEIKKDETRWNTHYRETKGANGKRDGKGFVGVWRLTRGCSSSINNGTQDNSHRDAIDSSEVQCKL